MGFEVSFDCPMFSLNVQTDTDPSPDVFDHMATRFNRLVNETLASVAPHAAVILGDDEDDDD